MSTTPVQMKVTNVKVSTKLRGHPRDDPEVRLSKTLSYILRHKADTDGTAIRQDGYVRVSEIVGYISSYR
jgi:RNA:NAD 2'-phosphotransferase (TPT1/KptA family)